MFGKRITLFNLLGFAVRIDASWLILAALITWSLARGYFPQAHPYLSTQTYWWMGVAGALGLFVSIVLHELAHSLVARREGIEMKGITLFIFGGVAEMGSEPPNAVAEIKMAIAGPIASFLIGGGFYALALAAGGGGGGAAVTGVLEYLAFINVILALFNMIPAFPLDGGRVLRGILWKSGKSLRQATGITSAIGAGFGFFLILLGLFSLFSGNFIAGLWWALIGMFIRGASQASFQQLTMRQAFEGEPVSRFMRTDPITVSAVLSLAELVEDYVYRYHYRMFPVVSALGELEGCVRVRDLQSTPREEWGRKRVANVMNQCSPDNTVSPQTDAFEALQAMQRGSNSSLLVADGGRVAGVVTLRDLLDFLTLKMDLEGLGPPTDARQPAQGLSPTG